VRIGIARRDVGFVELQRRVLQPLRHDVPLAELHEQVGDGVAPGLCPEPLEHGLHRLFGRLLRREARPVVEARLEIAPGVQEISLGLIHPVAASLCHVIPLAARPTARILESSQGVNALLALLAAGRGRYNRRAACVGIFTTSLSRVDDLADSGKGRRFA
jgi:hypothetical protein